MAMDPVCGMEVGKKKAPATATFKGALYYFCARECKKKFEKDPERYLKVEPGHKHS